MAIQKHWWKAVGVLLVIYSIYAGLMNDVPRLPILNETIRNLFFHVTMWFTMIMMMLVSFITAIMHLSAGKTSLDKLSFVFAEAGMLFSILGLLTGMLWAKYTWGDYFPPDPKLQGTVITMLIYAAYFVLRGSLNKPDQKGRISAIYNIFAFILMIVFIGILPRLTSSLHPGNGGNPGFNQYDMDSSLRAIFYPAVVGWILIGIWISNIRWRMEELKERKIESEEEVLHEIHD